MIFTHITYHQTPLGALMGSTFQYTCMYISRIYFTSLENDSTTMTNHYGYFTFLSSILVGGKALFFLRLTQFLLFLMTSYPKIDNLSLLCLDMIRIFLNFRSVGWTREVAPMYLFLQIFIGPPLFPGVIQIRKSHFLMFLSLPHDRLYLQNALVGDGERKEQNRF